MPGARERAWETYSDMDHTMAPKNPVTPLALANRRVSYVPDQSTECPRCLEALRKVCLPTRLKSCADRLSGKDWLASWSRLCTNFPMVNASRSVADLPTWKSLTVYDQICRKRQI